MKNRIGRYFLPFAVLSGAFLLAPSTPACYSEIYDSVHFYGMTRWNGGQEKIDFGRLPQADMPPFANDEAPRAGSDYGWDYQNWEEEEAREREKTFNRIRARNFEVRGQYHRALRAYKLSDASPAFVQDRAEVFKETGFEPVDGLQTYLYTGYVLGYGNYDQQTKALSKLLATKIDPKLRPHVAYMKAGARADEMGPEVARRYWEAYERYPKSSRAESAMIMAVRSMLGEREPKVNKPTTQEIAQARGWIKELLTKFPETRFRHNALGWLARCEWLSHDVNKALGRYLVQAKVSKDDNERWHAYESIVQVCAKTDRRDRQIVWLLRESGLDCSQVLRSNTSVQLRDVFPELGRDEVGRLQKTLRQDPVLLHSYLAFRLEYTTLSPRQEQNLLAFATSSLDSLPTAPGYVLSRVAQLNYNVGRYSSARQMARKAISSSDISTEERQRARYALAASEARLGRPQVAMQGYRTLIGQNPRVYLKQSAQENLAILEERHGDPVRAMAIYQDIGYDWDAAYLADARLTPEQLERFIDTYRFGPVKEKKSEYEDYGERLTPEATRKVLIYTLGMRYLRKERYDDARRAFNRLSKKDRLNWGMTATAKKALIRDGSIGYEVTPPNRDPLAVVAKLERWSQEVKSARTAARRAQALYDKAAYIYHERNLLFYSPGLWQGSRAEAIDIYWSKAMNVQADNNALYRHQYEHDCVAQALRLCDELVKKYPKSKLVPKALYTAAISADHLAGLNKWWRDRGDHLLKLAINRAKRIVAEYPNDPLAAKAQKYAGVFDEELQQPRY